MATSLDAMLPRLIPSVDLENGASLDYTLSSANNNNNNNTNNESSLQTVFNTAVTNSACEFPTTTSKFAYQLTPDVNQ